ncbi:MAG: polysaccharide export protein [Proteobacteria bacterium]|nr:polysaccharide export protein [Pseudomonadota bacterium]
MFHPKRLIAFICFCLACAGSWAQSGADTAPKGNAAAKSDATPKADTGARTDTLSKYLLSTGDVISITVFGEDDLKREKIRLTDAGTVSYPVLGEIQVRGKTVGELEKLLTDGLRGSYLVNPRVSVTIDEYRPYFINGQVSNNGSFPYQPGLTIRKAVSIAGGFKERASMSKIFIVRDGDATNTPIRVDLNAPVQPGDIVTVGESFF